MPPILEMQDIEKSFPGVKALQGVTLTVGKGEVHDVPNLYVVDGSGFPTALGVNPTLTMMAHAWRAAEFIADHHAKGRKFRLDRPVAASAQ